MLLLRSLPIKENRTGEPTQFWRLYKKTRRIMGLSYQRFIVLNRKLSFLGILDSYKSYFSFPLQSQQNSSFAKRPLWYFFLQLKHIWRCYFEVCSNDEKIENCQPGLKTCFFWHQNKLYLFILQGNVQKIIWSHFVSARQFSDPLKSTFLTTRIEHMFSKSN